MKAAIRNTIAGNLSRMRNTAAWQSAVEEQGKAILHQARINAPIRTGKLIRSGIMDRKRVKAGLNGVRISFRVPYAIYMHEKHYRARIKGGRRFLSKAINSEARLLKTHLQNELRKALRAGFVRTTT